MQVYRKARLTVCESFLPLFPLMALHGGQSVAPVISASQRSDTLTLFLSSRHMCDILAARALFVDGPSRLELFNKIAKPRKVGEPIWPCSRTIGCGLMFWKASRSNYKKKSVRVRWQKYRAQCGRKRSSIQKKKSRMFLAEDSAFRASCELCYIALLLFRCI